MDIPVVDLPQLPAILERVKEAHPDVKRYVNLDPEEVKLLIHSGSARDFVNVHLDVVYLLNALQVVQEVNRQLTAMTIRAANVVERPDADNLGRLAQAIAHPKETQEYIALVTQAGVPPEATA